MLLRLTSKGLALKSRAAHVFDCIGKAVGIDAETVGKIRDTIASIRDNIHGKDKDEA